MDKNQQDLGLKIAAGALVISFFMNWISYGPVGVSASRIVFSGGGAGLSDGFGFLVRILLLLIPVSGAVILYYFLQKEGKYPLDRKLLFCIPAAATVLFFILLLIRMNGDSDGYSSSVSTFDLLAFGFWLSLLASGFLVYLVYGNKKAPVRTTTEVEKENPKTPVV